MGVTEATSYVRRAILRGTGSREFRKEGGVSVIFALLAQTPGPSPDEAIGWAEKMSKGGVAVICLVVAIAAVVALIFMFKKLLDKSDEFKELEKGYRKTIEDKADKDAVAAEKRLSDAKVEADKSKDREMTLMKDRLQAEKESDATLAQAIRVIENNTRFAEKVDRKLDQVDDLKRLLTEMNDRLRRLEEIRRP